MTVPYIPALKDQHTKISSLKESAFAHWKKTEWSECLVDLESLLENLICHQHDERRWLFEKLLNLPKMNQGGPFCSYFFEFFMNNRPLLMASRLISENRGRAVELKIPAGLENFFSSGSLLTIPLEEQMACEFLCQELISNLKSDPSAHLEWNHRALNFLSDLISTNHLKEETCLWVAAGQALPPETYTSLSLLKSLSEAS